jgi:hypothetical protein
VIRDPGLDALASRLGIAVYAQTKDALLALVAAKIQSLGWPDRWPKTVCVQQPHKPRTPVSGDVWRRSYGPVECRVCGQPVALNWVRRHMSLRHPREAARRMVGA